MAEEKTFEAVVSFVPRERVLVRIASTSKELAEAMIRDMAADNVTDLKVESLVEVTEADPIPEGYEETPSEVQADKPKVH